MSVSSELRVGLSGHTLLRNVTIVAPGFYVAEVGRGQKPRVFYPGLFIDDPLGNYGPVRQIGWVRPLSGYRKGYFELHCYHENENMTVVTTSVQRAGELLVKLGVPFNE